MSSLLERKLQNHPSEYLSDVDLYTLLSGSADVRHSQLKRALAKGLLVRVCRGVYYLDSYLQRHKPHPFDIAQRIYGPSYISLQSALSYHQLIPEAVYTTTSVTINRRRHVKTPIGDFTYCHLPINHFFYAVERIEFDKTTFFLASPWKAITDYVYCHKLNWKGVEPLEKSLRIELDELVPPKNEMLKTLKNFYQHNRMNTFIDGIKRDYKL